MTVTSTISGLVKGLVITIVAMFIVAVVHSFGL